MSSYIQLLSDDILRSHITGRFGGLLQYADNSYGSLGSRYVSFMSSSQNISQYLNAYVFGDTNGYDVYRYIGQFRNYEEILAEITDRMKNRYTFEYEQFVNMLANAGIDLYILTSHMDLFEVIKTDEGTIDSYWITARDTIELRQMLSGEAFQNTPSPFNELHINIVKTNKLFKLISKDVESLGSNKCIIKINCGTPAGMQTILAML